MHNQDAQSNPQHLVSYYTHQTTDTTASKATVMPTMEQDLSQVEEMHNSNRKQLPLTRSGRVSKPSDRTTAG